MLSTISIWPLLSPFKAIMAIDMILLDRDHLKQIIDLYIKTKCNMVSFSTRAPHNDKFFFLLVRSELDRQTYRTEWEMSCVQSGTFQIFSPPLLKLMSFLSCAQRQPFFWEIECELKQTHQIVPSLTKKFCLLVLSGDELTHALTAQPIGDSIKGRNEEIW